MWRSCSAWRDRSRLTCKHLRRRLARLVDGLGHAGHVRNHVLGAARRLAHAVRDLRGGSRLLLHRAGDLLGVAVDLAHGGDDRLHGVDRAVGRVLNRSDLLLDVVGRLGGLVGERLHLTGHHGEAPARLTGARRLDGGVEREQIGLGGHVLDQANHVADPLRGGGETLDLEIGGARVLGDLADDAARGRDARADLADRDGKLLRRRGHGLHVGRGLVGGRGDHAHPLIGVARERRQRARCLVHRPCAIGERAENAGDGAAELVDQFLGALLRSQPSLNLAVLLALVALAPANGIRLEGLERLGDVPHLVDARGVRHRTVHVPLDEA